MAWKRRRNAGHAEAACSGGRRGAEIFDAVAGGDEHGFAQAELLLHFRERGGKLVVAEGDFFAQLDRSLFEGQAPANHLVEAGVHDATASASRGKTCALLSELMPQKVSRMKM
jgi:hypothetical protein